MERIFKSHFQCGWVCVMIDAYLKSVKDPHWLLEEDFLKPELFFAMDLKQEKVLTEILYSVEVRE